MNKKFEELRSKRIQANEKLGDLYVKAKGRELTAEEQIEEANLTREISQCEREMRALNIDESHANLQREMRSNEVGAQFRELLKDGRNQKRTILLNPGSDGAGTNVTGNIAASGAIELTIHDIIPTLHEGLDLPSGLRTVTGVIGNEVRPVSTDDVEMEEYGQIETCGEQTLNFADITPTPKRVALTVAISNTAIDNAAFDVIGFVQQKFAIALRKYLAKKVYSQAAWTGNKGPFSGLTPQTIVLGTEAYKNILAAVATFSDKGFFEGKVCLSMDRVTEAELKATPKIAGAAGGFVIENGLCCGYPYTVSHYVNTTLSGSSLVATSDRFIEIGYWEWFALQQHGNVRMVVDGTSAQVAKDNVTKIILNTEWSMTDLSIYINGGTPTGDPATYPTQAFGLYKIVEAESSSDI
jgi:hypothetical protein